MDSILLILRHFQRLPGRRDGSGCRKNANPISLIMLAIFYTRRTFKRAGIGYD